MTEFSEAALSSVPIPADYFARFLEAVIQLVNAEHGDHDLYPTAIDIYIDHFKPDENLTQDSPEFQQMVSVAKASSVRMRALTDLLGKGHLNEWRDVAGMVDVRHPAVVAAACRCPISFRGSGPEFQPIGFIFEAKAIAKTMGQL